LKEEGGGISRDNNIVSSFQGGCGLFNNCQLKSPDNSQQKKGSLTCHFATPAAPPKWRTKYWPVGTFARSNATGVSGFLLTMTKLSLPFSVAA